MHSRVFQVSKSPIKEENLITESRYYEWHHAEYVCQVEDDKNIIADLEWLQTATKGIEVDTGARTITITSKKEYFEEKLEKFRALAEELSTITQDEFMSSKSSYKFSDLEDLYNNKYSFYIDNTTGCCEPITLDDWIRDSEENKTYYVGSIFDYHY